LKKDTIVLKAHKPTFAVDLERGRRSVAGSEDQGAADTTIVFAVNIDLAPSRKGESPYDCPELKRKASKIREGIKSLFGQGNLRVGVVMREDLKLFGGFVHANEIGVRGNALIG